VVLSHIANEKYFLCGTSSFIPSPFYCNMMVLWRQNRLCCSTRGTSTVLWWWITHSTTSRNDVGVSQFLIFSLHFTHWNENCVRYTAWVISLINGEM
jgi:hypothetical protein